MHLQSITFIVLAAGCSIEPDALPDTNDSAPTPAFLESAELPAPTADDPSGTLACNLEYEAFAPAFATLPLTSFVVPMSTVSSEGASSSTKSYQLYAAVNPSPGYNLSFQVGVTRLSTGNDIMYLVLPPPVQDGAYLFESGTRITTVTVGGVKYDHLRVYCSLTP